MLSEVTNDPPIQECPAAAQDNLNSKGDKEIYSKERQGRQKEKIQQQLQFFKDVTLADVTIDEDNLISLSPNSISRTMVQNIMGVEPQKIGAKVLRQICVFLRVPDYNGKSKLETLDIIGHRKKHEHMELKMYLGEFGKQRKKRGLASPNMSDPRKRKTAPARSVASSITSGTSPTSPLQQFVDLTKGRYAESAALNQLKAKHIKLKTESKALSLYSTYMDMLSRERKRFKELRLEDDYKSDGSEAGEIRDAITLCTDGLKATAVDIQSMNIKV